MDVEQQKRYQLENLGIVRKDEISQGQCCYSHLNLATSALKCPQWVASVEVAAWNDFETNDPNPDGNCEGLDRIAGGHLHRARILSDVKNHMLYRETEGKHNQGSHQDTVIGSSRGKKRREKKQISTKFTSTPVSSRFNMHGIAAMLPIGLTSPQIPLVPQIHDHNKDSHSYVPIKEASHSQALGSQLSQRLSDPCDFMAAVNEASFTVPKHPVTKDSSNVGTLWPTIQNLIDLDFGDAVQPTPSGFTSLTWPREANQRYSAVEVSCSSSDTNITNAGQSCSSFSSFRKQHESVNLTHIYTSRRYDPEFLKKFSSIRKLNKPFHPDAAPIVRNQAKLYLPLIPVVSLSNISLKDTNSKRDYMGQEYLGGSQTSAILDCNC